MRIQRPKRFFFKIFGGALVVGSILLGYFQIQWISVAHRAEETRIRGEMHRSAERALDEAFDEIRALFSFAYITPENLANERWEDVADSLEFWEVQSSFPGLLEEVVIVPTRPGDMFMRYNEETGNFTDIEPPENFLPFVERLGEETAVEAYRRAFPALLREGYFAFPLSPIQPDAVSPPTVAAFLVLQVDVELLYSAVLPHHLTEHLNRYAYRITGQEKLYFSSLPEHDSDRPPDMVVPVFGDFFLEDDRPPSEARIVDDGAAERALRNPVARFWFLRTFGFPGSFNPQDIRTDIPAIEIFYPERSLESALRNRMLSNLLLGVGTLIVLLTSYFVLYALLVRTDKLRSRERDFVTSMSHELRTPLSVISATSDNLAGGVVENFDKVKRYGGLIRAQSQRLGKMVEGILFYSGLENREIGSLSGETVHLETFFEEIIENVKPAAEEAGVEIRLLIETRVEAIRSDPAALRIIAENLVVNSFRHGVQGTGDEEVRVIIRTRPPRLFYLIVEDDGPGVPQGEQKRIFEPFLRGERSREKQIPGSGLGLHIVRRVCEKLGGQISVESPYAYMVGVFREGARFSVKIPVSCNGEKK